MSILAILQIGWDVLSFVILNGWIATRSTNLQQRSDLIEERRKREIAENQRLILEQTRSAEYRQQLHNERGRNRQGSQSAK